MESCSGFACQPVLSLTLLMKGSVLQIKYLKWMLSKIDITAEVSPCIHAKDYSYIDLKLYLSLSAKIWVISLPDLYLFKQRFAMHKKHWDLHVSSAFISSQSVTAVPKCLWNFVLGFLVLPSGLSSTAILLQKQEKHWRLGVFGVVLPPEYAWSNIIFTDLQRHCCKSFDVSKCKSRNFSFNSAGEFK